MAQIAQDRLQARLDESQDNTPSASPAPQSLEHLALKAEPAAELAAEPAAEVNPTVLSPKPLIPSEGSAEAGGLVGALGLASTEAGDEVLPPFPPQP